MIVFFFIVGAMSVKGFTSLVNVDVELILGDPGARDDRMFVVKVFCKIVYHPD